jgi:hypothetical protein
MSVFVTGCSVIRKSGKSLTMNDKNGKSSTILKGTKKQNITNSGFFIKKAEIEILTKNGREKYLASIKFEKTERYLVSVKGRTGIEGARIYISNDSILVNDRINKKLYSGNTIYLEKKFGLNAGFLPLIFGDVILDKKCEDNDAKCVGSKNITECYLRGVILKYEIDCSRRKVMAVSQIDNFNNNVNRLKFSKFFSVGGSLIPKIIEFEGQFNTVVKIRIIKMEMPWSGIIKFIPGKGYESIELI